MSVPLADAGIKLSEDSRKVLHIAQRIATEYNHAFFSGPHLLKALLHPEFSVRSKLASLDKDIFYIEDWAEIRLDDIEKAGTPQEAVADDRILQVLEEAEILKLEGKDDEIMPSVLFAALTIPGLAFTYDQLKTLPVSKNEFINEAPGGPSQSNETTLAQKKAGKNSTSLSRFATYRNPEKIEKEIIGRDTELRLCFEILSRKAKPNVLIIGDSGVGKTSLIDGLVSHVQEFKASGRLQNANIFEIDLGILQLGTTYKGEVEDRFVKLLDEIRGFEQPVVVIEDIHQLIDKTKGLDGVAGYARNEMGKGEITFVGTTSTDQYRKALEKDETIAKRFEPLFLKEPDEQTAERMISGIIRQYEEHHGFTIGHEEVADAVRMAKRYIKDRKLPDSAIDLIDRTMASLRIVQDTGANVLQNLQTEAEKTAAKEASEQTNDVASLYQKFNSQISQLLMHRVGGLSDWVEGNDQQKKLAELKEKLDELTKTHQEYFHTVTSGDLATVVAERTGVPVGNVETRERERLLDMESHIRTRVIGQDHAVHSISEAVIESRSGLTKGKQPIGSFFFLGPTGTGKTELAKTLAEFLFGNEQAMIRFDMSEFKEEHSAALLYGAPPGYVGYEEGGMLVNKIRQQPYAVVLFDEIEKAHASVFDIFLQILDEGKLNDRLGRTGDFTNAIILFTSNIGSDHIVQSFSKGQIPASASLLEIMGNYFRPEFLGRLTEIVPFSPVDENMVVRILDIQLAELSAMLDAKGIAFEVDEQAKKIIAKAGYTPKYGARPLKGVIRDMLRRPLSRMIISEKIKAGDKVVCSAATSEGDVLDWKIESNP